MQLLPGPGLMYQGPEDSFGLRGSLCWARNRAGSTASPPMGGVWGVLKGQKEVWSSLQPS